MNTYKISGMVFVLLIALAQSAVPQTWTDPSPHRIQFVTIAPNVRLEVLDWGGRGDTLIFLSGLGLSAHVYDDFAPQFRDHFHVMAVTRRGFGASSQTSYGYDIETRVKDLVSLLDSLGVARASFIGHSIAGDELTGLAARFPSRVRRLVYLDAACDHTALLNQPKLPKSKSMIAADSASPGAVRAFWASKKIPLPEAEIRTWYVFAASGKIEREVTPDSITGVFLRGSGHPPYSQVSAPALAIYAMYDSPDSIVSPSRWAQMDSTERRKTTFYRQWLIDYVSNERARFRREMHNGEILEIKRTNYYVNNHYIFVSDSIKVADAIRRFLAQP
ncbi:MAG: alpha/beta hydrolase [Bacteroidota bacterium]